MSVMVLEPRVRSRAGDSFPALRDVFAFARRLRQASARRRSEAAMPRPAPPARTSAAADETFAIEVLDCPWNRPVARDVSGLVHALQAGDLATARKAYGARLREE